jgi:hypothetical protein
MARQYHADRSAGHDYAGILGFVTAEDSSSEENAVLAADRAIRELDT